MAESNQKLDDIAETVILSFANSIGPLNNNEVEYVLREFITRMENLLERVVEVNTNVNSR